MSDALVFPTKPRERINYNLNLVIPALLERARTNDRGFEEAIAEFVVAFDDTVITEREFREHLVRLIRLYKSNADLLRELLALDISGSEAALREVEQSSRKQKQAAGKRAQP